MKKPKRVYQQSNPSDCRIFIDFKNKKKPVTFQYPSKESSFSIVFHMIVGIFVQLLILFVILNFPIIMAWSFLEPIEARMETYDNSLYLISIMLMIFSEIGYILVALPILATLIFISKDNWMKQMPRIQMKMSMLYGGSISTIRVKKLNSKIYELPIFDNVFLEYKTTKDFARYLEKIEVTEHDFWIVKQPSFWKSFLGKKQSKRKQTDYWKARFFFKEIPKGGYLKIDFI